MPHSSSPAFAFVFVFFQNLLVGALKHHMVETFSGVNRGFAIGGAEVRVWVWSGRLTAVSKGNPSHGQ